MIHSKTAMAKSKEANKNDDIKKKLRTRLTLAIESACKEGRFKTAISICDGRKEYDFGVQILECFDYNVMYEEGKKDKYGWLHFNWKDVDES